MNKVLAFVFIAFACAANAQTQTPPQTPFPSPLGGLGGGGGGGGVAPGTACLLAGGVDCDMADPGMTFSVGLGGTGGMYVSTCTDNTGTYPCLVLDGGTQLAAGAASGTFFMMEDAFPIVHITSNVASTANQVFNGERETADGRSRISMHLWDTDKGSYILGTPNAGDTEYAIIGLNGDVTGTGDFTVHAGTNAARAAASAEPLFCASTTISRLDPNSIVQKTCAFADGTWQSGNGTAAKPSYSFLSAGNTDTGMYLDAADIIGFSANAEEIMDITADGVLITGPNQFAINGLLTTGYDIYVEDAGTASNAAGENLRATDASGSSRYNMLAGSSAGGDHFSIQMNGETTNGAIGAQTGGGIATAQNNLTIAAYGGSHGGLQGTILFSTSTGVAPAGIVERMRISDTEVVVNENSLSTVDFRAETDTDVNGIFLDASAETITFVGGSASTGADISATGDLTVASDYFSAATAMDVFNASSNGLTVDGSSTAIIFGNSTVEIVDSGTGVVALNSDTTTRLSVTDGWVRLIPGSAGKVSLNESTDTTLAGTDCDADSEVGDAYKYSKNAAADITLCVCQKVGGVYAFGSVPSGGDCT